ncbi:MAG: hypothetical protein R2688_01465 [Fimbriimonadaceae bacterium]
MLLATEYLHGLTGADAVEIFVPTPNGGLTLRASHDNPELSTRFRIGPEWVWWVWFMNREADHDYLRFE